MRRNSHGETMAQRAPPDRISGRDTAESVRILWRFSQNRAITNSVSVSRWHGRSSSQRLNLVSGESSQLREPWMHLSVPKRRPQNSCTAMSSATGATWTNTTVPRMSYPSGRVSGFYPHTICGTGRRSGSLPRLIGHRPRSYCRANTDSRATVLQRRSPTLTENHRKGEG